MVVNGRVGIYTQVLAASKDYALQHSTSLSPKIGGDPLGKQTQCKDFKPTGRGTEDGQIFPFAREVVEKEASVL